MPRPFFLDPADRKVTIHILLSVAIDGRWRASARTRTPTRIDTLSSRKSRRGSRGLYMHPTIYGKPADRSETYFQGDKPMTAARRQTTEDTTEFATSWSRQASAAAFFLRLFFRAEAGLPNGPFCSELPWMS